MRGWTKKFDEGGGRGGDAPGNADKKARLSAAESGLPVRDERKERRKEMK